MGIFNLELDIDSSLPFENDKLARENEIKNLTNLFDVVENQMVLAINSRWGTGKTSFMKMWQAYLNGENYRTLYFNCWENDYVEEPFIAFIQEIEDQLHDNKEKEVLLKTGKRLGRILSKNLLGVSINILLDLLSDKFGQKVVEDIVKLANGEISEINLDCLKDSQKQEIEKIADTNIAQYIESKKLVIDFKEELTNLAKAQGEKPIVIFIDELDRCRPNFAIATLERVKHLFNVENIIFILGMDKDALSNSIKVIYGEGTDIGGYLSRFIDIEVPLNIGKIENDKYVKHILEKYKHYIDKQITDSNFVDDCINIISIFEFSLRDIEKVIIKLILILRTTRTKERLFYVPFIFLLCVNRYDINLYNKIIHKNINVHSVLTKIYESNKSNLAEEKSNVSDSASYKLLYSIIIVESFLLSYLNSETIDDFLNVDFNKRFKKNNELEFNKYKIHIESFVKKYNYTHYGDEKYIDSIIDEISKQISLINLN